MIVINKLRLQKKIERKKKNGKDERKRAHLGWQSIRLWKRKTASPAARSSPMGGG